MPKSSRIFSANSSSHFLCNSQTSSIDSWLSGVCFSSTVLSILVGSMTTVFLFSIENVRLSQFFSNHPASSWFFSIGSGCGEIDFSWFEGVNPTFSCLCLASNSSTFSLSSSVFGWYLICEDNWNSPSSVNSRATLRNPFTKYVFGCFCHWFTSPSSIKACAAGWMLVLPICSDIASSLVNSFW